MTYYGEAVDYLCVIMCENIEYFYPILLQKVILITRLRYLLIYKGMFLGGMNINVRQNVTYYTAAIQYKFSYCC